MVDWQVHTLDDNIFPWLVSALCLQVLNLSHNALSVDHLAENHMLLVQMGRGHRCNEELATVGAGAGIGHAKQERLLVHDFKVLVLELLAVDALAAHAIALGEVTALDHELLDDAVEAAALVVKGLSGFALAFLARAEGAEVLGGFGNNVIVQLERDPARLLCANGDVEEAPCSLCEVVS